MPSESFDEQNRVISEAEKYLGEKPRILVCGKTGAGKSSLINALLDEELNPTDPGAPTTQKAQEEAWTIGKNSLQIIDVPGFGEADKHEQRLDFIFEHLSTSHVGLLVVGAPDRAWEYEQQFMQSVAAIDPQFPMLVVGNKIDMFNPVREWKPETLNLAAPSTQKEKSIIEWSTALRTACGINESHLLLTSVGDSFKNREERYGLEELARSVVNTLPAAVQNAAARAMRVDIDKRDLAEKIIWAASVSAATVALVPIPFADCIPLAALQVGLIIKIADIYGQFMTKETAFNLLSPVAASFAGRITLASLLDFFPGIGTIAGALIGAGIAGPMTFAIGKTYLEFFARDNFKPTKEEICEQLKSNYREARKQRHKMEEEARAQREKTYGGHN